MKFFNEEFLDELAKSVGFLKRQRKITTLSFLNTLLFHAFSKQTLSLNDHLIDLNQHENIILTKQSLHQRFGSASVAFIKRLVELQCKNQIKDESLMNEILTDWDHVYVHDSCQFTLPDCVSTYFKGYGGNTKSNSICKIQHGYDLKSGNLHIHEYGDASNQDTTSGQKTLDSYGAKDLILRDLGYFDLKSFNLLNKPDNGDFVSRLKPKTVIFEISGERIDLGDLYKKMKKNNIACIDKQVIIGTKKPTEVRMIITLAPGEVKKERIRKTEKQNKSYGYQTSKEFKQYAAFNIFITNVDKQKLSAEHITRLYRLRWQIEIMFKTWKSYYQIHKFNSYNCYRVLTYLYANLLLVLINWELSAFFANLGYLQKQHPLSIMKLMKGCLQYKQVLREWCRKEASVIIFELEKMFVNMLQNTVLEKRKKRYNYEDIVNSFI